AAEDAPRASITAAPRFWIVSTNLPLSQPWSEITSNTGRPAIRALAASGYCAVEWLPQPAPLDSAATGTLAFLPGWLRARLPSGRDGTNHRSGAMSAALLPPLYRV